MPSSLKYYKNKDKARAYNKRNRDRYYKRSADSCSRNGKPWQEDELQIIMNKEPLTDYELSLLLNRSITSIQVKRTRLKQKESGKIVLEKGNKKV